MTSENLKLWSELERTDPNATKPFQRGGGFKGTQIDPVWRMRRMTEIFGPVGKGWGYAELQHVITDGMVFIQLQVWYKIGNEVMLTGPQWGGTELFNKRSGGLVPNDEAFKMSTTDALGRCFLQIGLAADVYLGLFDDSKYQEETVAKIAAKDDPALSAEAIKEFESKVIERLEEVNDLTSLDTIWKTDVSARIKEIKKVDKDAAARITALFTAQKAKLTGVAEAKKEAEKKPNAPADVAAARTKFKEIAAAIAEADAKTLRPLFEASMDAVDKVRQTSPEGAETILRKFDDRAKELKVSLTDESEEARRVRLMTESDRILKQIAAASTEDQVNKLNLENEAVLNEISKFIPAVYDTVMTRFDKKISSFFPLT